jgi:adenylate cyclase
VANRSKGQAIDVKQVGRELGVRCALEGSGRKSGNGVRITAQLIEADTGIASLGRPLRPLARGGVRASGQSGNQHRGRHRPTLQAAETRRSSYRPTKDLTACDFYLRALPCVATYQWEPVLQGFDLLARGIERDPDFASALARAAYCHATLDATGRLPDLESNRHTAIGFPHRALRAAGADALALAGVAHVLGYFNEHIDAAIGIIDRSLALDPNSAHGC